MMAMAQLRWILLGAGALFLLGLALWEWRRPRHAASDESQGEVPESTAWRDHAAISTADDADIVIPEMRAGDSRRDPPLVMLDELTAADTDIGVQVAMEVAVDRPGSQRDVLAAMPRAEPLPEHAADTGGSLRGMPIIWPPARQERIIWLRVVPAAQDRFSGRAVRQALTSCGMEHGPQEIFHWADERGEVVASAANLVRPGSFDPDTMDSQHYQGLHLFSVLPGPLPGMQTFDELLGLGRDIAARLDGVLQDERGQSVDVARVAEIRASLEPDLPAGEAGEADA
jgi:hypothetical protein